MKSLWSIVKHAMWYASVIVLPIFLIGDFAYVKIPQLLNGFSNPFEIFVWAIQTNGSIISPWLAATAWRIVVRDPEDPRDFPTLPGFCRGGDII